MRISAAAVLLALLAGAATLDAQSPEAVAKHEAARAAEPSNVGALRSLGIAYYKAERFADASAVLEEARALAADDRLVALYAGLSAERLPDYAKARTAYNAYLEMKRPWYAFRAKRSATQVRNRLVAMAHDESIARAKAAVAAEAELAAQPGPPNTIAVPPMRYVGPDAENLAPLERGLAELVITDLAKSSQLTLVERDRMQALADEIQLGASGAVDSVSVVRAGRLIQAGRLVNGNIVHGGDQFTLGSSVVSVPTSQISSPVRVTDAMDKFFDLQKALVFEVFDQLDVTLTAEERAAIGVKQTENFEAFLLYSRGLLASDAGRFSEAAALFRQARAADPSFAAAATRASLAQAAAMGAQVNATTLEAALPRGERGVITSASLGAVAPPAPPLGFLPSIPKLPSASAGPLGRTLAATAASVNPPTVSPISNAAGAGASGAPSLDLPGNISGYDRMVVIQGVLVFMAARP